MVTGIPGKARARTPDKQEPLVDPAAYIDPAKGQPLWRKRFSKAGARPSVAIAPSGQAQLVWFLTPVPGYPPTQYDSNRTS